jgi:hypothetical protein
MPTNVDSIHIKIPRRLRRRLPEGYVANVGKREYKPVNINGVLCQRPVDAIRQCIGIHMRERLLQASENAYKLGYMDKSDLDHLSKELSNA